MPEIVDKLTELEQRIEKKIRNKFTEEQICAYFLTKTVRSIYQFDDKFVHNWYVEIFEKKPDVAENTRREIVHAYSKMLILEQKYRFHFDYWLRQYQERLFVEMQKFFGGDAGK